LGGQLFDLLQIVQVGLLGWLRLAAACDKWGKQSGLEHLWE